jgi:hypothetical protein
MRKLPWEPRCDWPKLVNLPNAFGFASVWWCNPCDRLILAER